jgi:hypothetical protein
MKQRHASRTILVKVCAPKLFRRAIWEYNRLPETLGLHGAVDDPGSQPDAARHAPAWAGWSSAIQVRGRRHLRLAGLDMELTIVTQQR